MLANPSDPRSYGVVLARIAHRLLQRSHCWLSGRYFRVNDHTAAWVYARCSPRGLFEGAAKPCSGLYGGDRRRRGEPRPRRLADGCRLAMTSVAGFVRMDATGVRGAGWQGRRRATRRTGRPVERRARRVRLAHRQRRQQSVPVHPIRPAIAALATLLVGHLLELLETMQLVLAIRRRALHVKRGRLLELRHARPPQFSARSSSARSISSSIPNGCRSTNTSRAIFHGSDLRCRFAAAPHQLIPCHDRAKAR